MTIEQRVRALGGCARTCEVATTSADRERLRSAVVAGRLVRVRRGVVAVPGRAEVAGLALAYGGAPTCLTVIEAAGLPLLRPPGAVHVAVPTRRGRAPGARDLRLHWTTEPITPRVPVSLALALAHARGCLAGGLWIAAVDAAVGQQLVSVADVAAHRPATGRVAFDAALRAVDGRSGSLPETVLRLSLRRLGLAVTPQAWIEGVGRVDLLVEDCVVVEVDGFAYHRDRGQYREDRRRDRVAHLLGLEVLRFTFEDVMSGSERAAFEVAELVRHVRSRADDSGSGARGSRSGPSRRPLRSVVRR